MPQNKIEKIVFGGNGLIRHEGLVVFVPDVLPGEEVEFEITKKKKSFAYGCLQKVVEPSSDRVEPRCPHFGTCGGCQLQHIAYHKQLELKVEWLEESLKRIAGLTLTVPITAHPAEKPYGYRKKIVLQAKDGKVGYVDRDYNLFDVKTCPIFIDGSTDLFEQLKGHDGRIVVCKVEDRLAVHVEGEKTDELYEMQVAGLHCYYSPEVFIQNDPEQFLKVYNKVIEKIDKGPILDLYCGIGILPLLLALKGFDVTGVELNAKAVACANLAKEKNGIENVQFKAMKAEDVAGNYPVWIVNPPRTGLSDEMKKKILKSAPAQVLYVSCEPSTLARDLKALTAKYRIESLDLFDMFAQTTHFETVVHLNQIF